MRKMLILLAVAMVLANVSGCCCRRLCPLLDRGAPCGCCLFPQPAYTPVVAAPCPSPCPPTYAPMVSPQQYVVPTAQTMMPQSYAAAPMAQPCCPQPCAAACPPQPCCTKWDPCQCAVVAMPQQNYGAQPACCPPAASCCPPQQVIYEEPSCAYIEASCEGPMLGAAAYGCDDGCQSGCCDGGGGQVIEGSNTPVPAPQDYQGPQYPEPAGESEVAPPQGA
jgi:hypothetical protein